MAPPKTPDTDRREPSSASWQTRYRVERELGEGASGRVVLAHDTRLNRHVALKMLAPELLSSARMKKRFLREAQALAGLDHPHVLKVLDILEEEGSTVLVLEYAPEGTLEKRLEGGPLPLAEAVAMTKGLLLGLEALHGQGLVHRDVKPANVLLGVGGVPKVADLGIAQDAGQSRMTKKGARLGTPEYMSPEQVQDQELDGRSDVYAAGIVLFELLTGKLPYEAPNEFAVLAWHVSGSVAWERGAGRVPEGLKAVLGRALAKKREERYASAGEFAQALEAAANPRVAEPPRGDTGDAAALAHGRSVEERNASTAIPKPPRRAGFALGLVMALALGGCALVFGRGANGPSDGPKGEAEPGSKASTATASADPKAASSALNTEVASKPVDEARSCAKGGPGRSDCGSSHESCCTSLPVPGGKFLMEYDGFEKDSTHKAEVADYRLDKYEVTVGRFRSFVEAWAKDKWRPKSGEGKHRHLNGGKGLSDGAGGYESGWESAWAEELPERKAVWDAKLACSKDYGSWTSEPGEHENRPINCVTWYEAVAFCIWDGGHLPSEAEWNYAASGGDEQRDYPWSKPRNSTEITADHAVYSSPSVQSVGSKEKGAGRWGQLDLAGNVWEWNLDWYDKLDVECNNCAKVRSGSDRVIRGRGFVNNASDLRASYRYGSYDSPTFRYYGIGLRCSRTP